MLDQLVLDGAVTAHLAGGGVAAVEAHEGVGQLIVKLAADVLVIDVLRHAVVDVQQGDGVTGGADADVLGQSAVDIDLAGDGDAAAGKAGVDIAGLKAELRGEGGPALVGKGNILFAALVVLGPVEQGQLKLRHAGQQVGVVMALAHLGGHVLADLLDAGVARVLFVGDEQVQLGVFLDLNTQLIQALDGGVAGKEVLRAGAEGDDLQVTDAQNGAGDGDELGHLVGDLLSGADRILGDIALEMAHTEVVGAVQHTAVGIAAAVDHVAVTLGGGHEHAGAVEELGNQGFGGLGAEVAQKDGQRVAAGLGHLGNGLLHVMLVFHGGLALVEGNAPGLAGGCNGSAALFAQCDRKAVTADGDNAELDLRNVGGFHGGFLRFL